jgi:hypothetical protein
MKIGLVGKMSAVELDRGEKPEYLFLKTPRKVSRICSCRRKDCVEIMKHGYAWKAEWVLSHDDTSLKRVTVENLRFWKSLLDQIRQLEKERKHQSSTEADLKYLIEILTIRIRKWKTVLKQIINK